MAAYLAASFAFDMHWTYKLQACHCADVGRIACIGSAYAPFLCYAANNSAQGHRLIWCIAVVHTVVAGGLAAQHVLHMFKTTTIKKKLKTRCTLCGDVQRVFSFFYIYKPSFVCITKCVLASSCQQKACRPF